jgi:predicted Zn finger-like uncharacterized protein
MLIVCPNCATSYRVETAPVGQAGRAVCCVRCRNVWAAGDWSVLPDIDQKWEPVLRKRTCSNKVIEQDDDSTKRHPALEPPPDDAVTYMPEWPAASLQGEVAATEQPGSEPARDCAEPAADAGHAERNASRMPAAHQRARLERARLERARLGARSLLPFALGGLLALHGALIGWRAEVVKLAPQTARLYAAIGLPVNLRGLTFANVTTAIQMQDGVPVLVVEGAIASASSRPIEVPRLRLSIRNGKGQEIYAWTELPERSVLAPREILAFRSRLASPPPDTGEVVVRFLNRNDLVLGIRHAEAGTTAAQ